MGKGAKRKRKDRSKGYDFCMKKGAKKGKEKKRKEKKRKEILGRLFPFRNGGEKEKKIHVRDIRSVWISGRGAKGILSVSGKGRKGGENKTCVIILSVLGRGR